MFDECKKGPERTDASAQNEFETCAGCHGSISDKYLLRIRSLVWHEQCVTCCTCNCQLSEGCFVRDSRLYCAHDYAKRHGTRCQSCGQPIATQDLAMRAGGHAYHLACFACAACGAQLRKGDQFALRPADGKPVCMCEAAAVVGSGGGGDCSGSSSSVLNCGDDSSGSQQQGRRGSRADRKPRVRTVLTAGQRRQFRAAFEANPKPSRRTRDALAAEAGLSARVVQVWFQNQRAKLKKCAPAQQRAARPRRAVAGGIGDCGEEEEEDLEDEADDVDDEDNEEENDDDEDGEAEADEASVIGPLLAT